MIDPVTGIKTAYTVYEVAKKERATRRAINFFKRRRRILVLGASGAGKTQFVKSLVARINAEIPRAHRTQTAVSYLYEIAQDPYTFTDTPGQHLHASARREEILKVIKSNYDGIINVVSFGYHEGDRDSAEAVGDDGLPKQAFLERSRQDELTLLAEWTSLVGASATGKWLITVITKADLWWDQRVIVRKHYESGDYRKALETVDHLKPMTSMYCSLQHPFFDRAPMSGLFGTVAFQQLYADFFRVFGEAVGNPHKG